MDKCSIHTVTGTNRCERAAAMKKVVSIIDMQPDGNLVLYGTDPTWSSKTQGYPDAYYVMQPDGNLIIHSQDDNIT